MEAEFEFDNFHKTSTNLCLGSDGNDGFAIGRQQLLITASNDVHTAGGATARDVNGSTPVM